MVYDGTEGLITQSPVQHTKCKLSENLGQFSSKRQQAKKLIPCSTSYVSQKKNTFTAKKGVSPPYVSLKWSVALYTPCWCCTLTSITPSLLYSSTADIKRRPKSREWQAPTKKKKNPQSCVLCALSKRNSFIDEIPVDACSQEHNLNPNPGGFTPIAQGLWCWCLQVNKNKWW